jgi:predicted RNase H-like nuclease (RuvC/YqgF family)
MPEKNKTTDWQAELRKSVESSVNQLIAEGKFKEDIFSRAKRLLYEADDAIRDAVCAAHEAGLSKKDVLETVEDVWDWMTKYAEDQNTAKEIIAGTTTLEKVKAKLRLDYNAYELEERLQHIEDDVKYPEAWKNDDPSGTES